MLTIRDIREFMGDESPEDNPAQLDLLWSDAAILASMRACALAYNTIEPQCETVQPEALPDGDAAFINGVAYDLCRKTLNQLRNRDVTYSAGGVTASITKDRIRHFESMMKEYGENFKTQAQARKLRINLNAAYGHYS